MTSVALTDRSPRLVVAGPEEPLQLERGGQLSSVEVAYATFGRLNADRSNVVLICHALTGDAHVADDPQRGITGWWQTQVGPGKAIDTNRYFVICSNVLGGCSGTTGPGSRGLDGRSFGLDFPTITLGDMVAVQQRLLDQLGIERLHAIVGGSLGGMQVLQWLRTDPGRVGRAAVVGCGRHLEAEGVALNSTARDMVRLALEQDPDNPALVEGALALARRIAHVTYRSASALQERFGRTRRGDLTHEDFSLLNVESYLAHKGRTFVRRFDPYSYMYLTEAMDQFEFVSAEADPADGFAGYAGQLLLVGIESDWLFRPRQTLELQDAAARAGCAVKAHVLKSSEGHDAFLLPNPTLTRALQTWLQA